MKALFNGERRAVAAGKDRQPFIAESEGLTAEARKRGPRRPSDASMAYVADREGAIRPPTTRPQPQQGREEDGHDGLAGCRGANALSAAAPRSSVVVVDDWWLMMLLLLSPAYYIRGNRS